MRFPQGWELVVLLLVVLVLFGSKRLPDAARGLGRSLRIFKSEVNEMRDGDADGRTDGGPAAPLPPGETSAGGQTRPEGSGPTGSDRTERATDADAPRRTDG